MIKDAQTRDWKACWYPQPGKTWKKSHLSVRRRWMRRARRLGRTLGKTIAGVPYVFFADGSSCVGVIRALARDVVSAPMEIHVEIKAAEAWKRGR